MEATIMSVGKAMLDGVLGCAQSSVVEEMKQQLGIERDVGFITAEQEMMQSFLISADEEQDPKKVDPTWVKQVRDLAYNVEDSLMDYKVYSEVEKPSWWCFARKLHDRHRMAMELKDLRDRVEDVSRRSQRYHISSDGSKHGAEQGHIARMLGIDKAWDETLEDVKSPVDLVQLINSVEKELRVVAVWGSSGELGKTTEVRKAYDDPKVKTKFGCRAWVRLMRPFNPSEFIKSLVRQFYVNSDDETSMTREAGTTVGANILLKMENLTQSDLVHVFNEKVNSKSYLIVINDLSTIEEWDFIRTYFPDKKMRSRIVVSTQELEVACLCTEQPYQVSELKQLSPDQILYLIHKKMWYSVMPTTLTIQRKLGRSLSETRSVTPEDIVLGRSTEKQKLIHLLGQSNDDNHGSKVISVWGMGGIGKTTLVRSIYRSQQLGGWKRAWATASRPFNSDALLWNLALQLQTNIEEDSVRADTVKQKKDIRKMRHQEMSSELSRLLAERNCLIVLDDLSTTEEWDSIKDILVKSKMVIVTTREKSVAEHCSEDEHNIYNLVGIQDDAAIDLLKIKVFSDTTSFELHPRMLDQAKLFVKKCEGLPLGISTIGGYLKFKPKTPIEWRNLNGFLNKELKENSDPNKLTSTVLMRSYDGLPYHLKASFLYLSIFPEKHIIPRKRLVRRWIAEGYARQTGQMKAEQVGDKHFDELVHRSMILPMEGGRGRRGEIEFCQLHDLIHEICVSKARAENLVLTLEEGFNHPRSTQQGAIRHLAISSSWKRDKDVIQKIMPDLSHVRSLTVFGEWRSFLISKKMRFLRVLDLEHTTGLRDHHLDKIGELIHVRYLSLRGCKCIFRLPDSVGNLRQLQTLDVSGTCVQSLPTCVTKLQKLEYLYASGFLRRRQDEYSYKQARDGALLDGHAIAMCGTEVICLGQRGRHLAEDGFSRHGMCSRYRPYLIMHKQNAGKLRGVQVPRGISRLKFLHTLRVVNITDGNATFQELRELTQLRKLGVTGVGKGNSEKFWLAIATHYGLRSLSVYNPYVDNELDGCLGGDLLPPKRLESLKMYGKLVKVAEWIHRLQNLSKLQLEKAELNQDALEAIGTMLPNLAVLCLRDNSFVGELLRFQGLSFPSLLVLELDLPESVCFEQEAMPKLEVIQAYRCNQVKEFSGLRFLANLVEIRLDGDVNPRVQRQLAKLQKTVALRLL